MGRWIVVVAMLAAAWLFAQEPEAGKLYSWHLPQEGMQTIIGFRAVDGDTFEGAFLVPVTIRAYGINAPERGRPGADEAKAALAKIVEGKTVTAKLYGREKYGRTLGDVWVGGEDKWLSVSFVRQGLAKAYLPR